MLEASTKFSLELPPLGVTGSLRHQAEDFFVSELSKFEPTGDGQHLALHIQKRHLNTSDLVAVLSKFFKVSQSSIGYFGLKDKRAVTQQWLSVDLAGSKVSEDHLSDFTARLPVLLKQALSLSELPDLDVPDSPDVKILSYARNSKKFRIGQLAGNRFELRIRNLKSSGVDSLSKNNKAKVEQRLEHISAFGFANYFGEQRFGINQSNIESLKKHRNNDYINLKKRRALRSRMISTLRAWGFNYYLSTRIERSIFRTYVDGDVLQFSDGNSLFSSSKHGSVQGFKARSDEFNSRLSSGELVLTGPMMGIEESLARDVSLSLEKNCLKSFESFEALLNHYKVSSARRAVLAYPKALEWSFEENDLLLSFELKAGSYASSLVREIVEY